MKKYVGLKFIDEHQTDAIIEIYGAIGVESWKKEYDENTARQMSEELNRIKAMQAKNITVKINSLGGDVNHALAIHDLLAEHSAQITTQINGLCASAATLIALAGKNRKMSKNALFLIHQCSAYVGRANAVQLAAELESQKIVNERILSIYVDKCPDKKEEITNLLNENGGLGKWIDATTARNLGLITDVYNDNRKAAFFEPSGFQDNGLPELPAGYTDCLESSNTTAENGNSWQDFLDTLTNYLSNHTHKKTISMKKLFPFLMAAAVLTDELPYNKEKGHTFTDEQLQSIETQLKAYSDLKTTSTKEMETMQNSINTLTADRDRLKSIVDAIPANNPQINGSDQTPKSKDDMVEYVNQSSLYQSLKSDI